MPEEVGSADPTDLEDVLPEDQPASDEPAAKVRVDVADAPPEEKKAT